MLTYFLGGYNSYNIRTKQIPSGSNILGVYTQNMSSLEDFAFNAGSWSYNECESVVGITFNLEIALNPIPGDEYRISLRPSITSSTTPFTTYPEIWNGSLQVFASQSVNKPAYVNQIPIASSGEGQIPCEISRQSDNDYIIYETDCPQPGPVTTSTTTTAGPTTTTTSTTSTTSTTTSTTSTTTSTTTTLAPTTTTTTTASPVDLVFYFGNLTGVNGTNICWSGSNSSGTGIGIQFPELKTFMSSDAGCTTPYGTSWDLNPPNRDYFFSAGMMDSGLWSTSSGGVLSPGNFYRTRISGSVRIDVGGFSPIETFDLTGTQYKDITQNGKTARILGPNCALNSTAGC